MVHDEPAPESEANVLTVPVRKHGRVDGLEREMLLPGFFISCVVVYLQLFRLSSFF